VNAFAIDSTLAPLEGTQDGIVRVAVHSKRGFQAFNPLERSMDNTVNEKFSWINGEQDSYSSMFTETWSSSLVSIRLKLHDRTIEIVFSYLFGILPLFYSLLITDLTTHDPAQLNNCWE
jgi:hypothetical protein